MPFAILRLEKRKGQQTAAINKHHERTKERYGSNPDIDHSRTKRNYHLVKPQHLYRKEVEDRIKAAGCRVRKDSVKFIDVLVGATPDFIDALPEEQVREFFERALRFIQEEVGAENVFTAVVHRDERTPHMHVCFTPITEDKRLSARDYMGGRARLIQWQDRFHAHMSERWPELERGAPAAESNRKHLPVQLFKQATRLDAQIAEISRLLADVTVFNAKAKRAELEVALAKLLPAAERYKRQVEHVEAKVSSLKKENAALENNLQTVKEENDDLFAAVQVLEARNAKVERLLRRIPEEVLDAARAKPHRDRAR